MPEQLFQSTPAPRQIIRSGESVTGGPIHFIGKDMWVKLAGGDLPGSITVMEDVSPPHQAQQATHIRAPGERRFRVRRSRGCQNRPRPTLPLPTRAATGSPPWFALLPRWVITRVKIYRGLFGNIFHLASAQIHFQLHFNFNNVIWNPTEEYRRVLKEVFNRKEPSEETRRRWKAISGKEELTDDSLSFSNGYFYLFSRFLGSPGLDFTGYAREDGTLVADLSEELCQKIADFLEKNGPFTAEQLPPKWRNKVDSNAKALMDMIPIFRYSGGIAGSN